MLWWELCAGGPLHVLRQIDQHERGKHFIWNWIRGHFIYLIGSAAHIIGVAYPLEVHDIACAPGNCSRSQAASNGHILGLPGRNAPCL